MPSRTPKKDGANFYEILSTRGPDKKDRNADESD